MRAHSSSIHSTNSNQNVPSPPPKTNFESGIQSAIEMIAHPEKYKSALNLLISIITDNPGIDLSPFFINFSKDAIDGLKQSIIIMHETKFGNSGFYLQNNLAKLQFTLESVDTLARKEDSSKTEGKRKPLNENIDMSNKRIPEPLEQEFPEPKQKLESSDPQITQPQSN